MYKYKYFNGYREQTMIVDRNLSAMPTAKAGVGICHDGTRLISYGTVIINITPDGWLTCTGTYSPTTRKHISAFIREYAPRLSYYDAKRAYEGHHKININTGEIVPL